LSKTLQNVIDAKVSSAVYPSALVIQETICAIKSNKPLISIFSNVQQEAEEAVNKISRTFSTLSEKQLDEQLDGVTDFLDSLTCSTTNSRKTNQPKQPDAASIERRNITDCKRKPVKPEFYDPSDPKTPQSSNKKRKPPQASYQYVSSDDENYFINDDDNDKQSRNKKIKQNNKYEYGDEYSDDEDYWKSSSVVAAPDSSAGTAAKTDEVPPPNNSSSSSSSVVAAPDSSPGTAAKTDEVPPPNNSSSSSSSVVAAPDSSTKEGVPITQPMPLSKELTDNDGIVVLLSERINQMVSIFAKLKMYIINKT